MAKTLAAVFEHHFQAENAANQLSDEGYNTDEISIVARQGDKGDDSVKMMNDKMEVKDNISDGAITGGVLGGLAGLLIGAGTMAIPGLGIIAAAGPITGLLGGAVTGGIIGGLIDLGIPEEKGEQYETDIKAGKIVMTMKVEEDEKDRVASIIRNNGAESVEIY